MQNNDKFRLFGKWFWIGIVVGFLNSIAGLIYGIALVTEKEYRREGAIIVAWTVLVAVLMTIVLGYVYPQGVPF